MSLGDVPKFPRKYKLRGDKLVEKLEQSEITMKEVLDNIFSTLGMLTIDSGGIKVTGKFGAFEVDPEIYEVMNDSIDGMMAYMMKSAVEIVRRRMAMLSREREDRKVYLKFGDRIFRFTPHTLYVGVWKATEGEIADTRFPLIEIIPTEKLLNEGIPIADLFESYISNRGLPVLGDYMSLKIYRPEKLVEWFDLSWEEAGEMMGMILPMMALARKETLDKLGASYPAFWDDVFTKCGV
ncbi:MAG: hypothetical protein JW738_04970 [Actinobacteria bacterium]|nr:hypothetical protein [Actinomycetota bacterium]